MPEFECDLDPETLQPRIRFNFPNGWTASIVFATDPRGTAPGTIAATASVAAFPTGLHGTGRTELGPTEAGASEAALFIESVRQRGRFVSRRGVRSWT